MSEQADRDADGRPGTRTSSRRLTATLLGLLAGTAGFGLLILAGWLLYQRLWGDSITALWIILVLFGAAGLYAGWLLGLIVFSALRGPEEEGEETVA
jgi:TRAP-type C4-dicarboxylate transport system permease small subunit